MRLSLDEMCPRHVPSVCALGMCPRHVPSACALGMCPRHVPSTCAHYFVPNRRIQRAASQQRQAGERLACLCVWIYSRRMGRRCERGTKEMTCRSIRQGCVISTTQVLQRRPQPARRRLGRPAPRPSPEMVHSVLAYSCSRYSPCGLQLQAMTHHRWSHRPRLRTTGKSTALSQDKGSGTHASERQCLRAHLNVAAAHTAGWGAGSNPAVSASRTQGCVMMT